MLNFKTDKGLYIEVTPETTSLMNAKYTCKNPKHQGLVRMQCWTLKREKERGVGEWSYIQVTKNKSGKTRKKIYLNEKLFHYGKAEDKNTGTKYYKIPLGAESMLSGLSWEEDATGSQAEFRFKDGIDLYDHDDNNQVQAIDLLTQSKTGLLHADTGCGKTMMMFGIAKKLCRKTLIITSSSVLVPQIADEANSKLGISPHYMCSGIKGYKKYRERENFTMDMQVGLIHTLCEMPREYFDQFGLIMFDEADTYISSDRFRTFLGSLSPDYLYGFTGTVNLNNMPDHLLNIYLGGTIRHKVLNYIPNIHRILTDYDYYGEVNGNEGFAEMIRDCSEDHKRNDLIVDTIKQTLNGKKGVLFTKLIDHIHTLDRLLTNIGIKTFLVYGDVKQDERDRIKQEIKDYEGECILIGNVKCIGRGYDLPELSTGYLVVQETADSNIRQYIGRIIREHKNKKGVDFYDFCDINVQMLDNQAKKREKNYIKTYPNALISYY